MGLNSGDNIKSNPPRTQAGYKFGPNMTLIWCYNGSFLYKADSSDAGLVRSILNSGLDSGTTL